MNLHVAMLRVGELLDRAERDARAEDGSLATVATAEELDAIAAVLRELLAVRKRAQDLGLLNLLSERRDDATPTQPALPDGEEEA